MTDAISCTPATPAAGFRIEADRARAMQRGNSFNGTQFTYRDFKYHRLRDAIAYAEHDRRYAGQHPEPSR